MVKVQTLTINRNRLTTIGVAVITSLLLLVVAGRVQTANAVATVCGNAAPGYNVIISDAAVINGTSGKDYICAGNSTNRIKSGGGDDVIFGRGGDDFIWPDSLGSTGSTGDDKVYAGEGDDKVFGEGDNDYIRGGIGNDSIDAGAWGDSPIYRAVVYGEAGNDTIRGTSSWSPLLAYGGPGKDVLLGSEGPDVLYGNDGNDRIYGGWDSEYGGPGSHHDIMYGQAGSDTLVKRPGDITRQ